MTTKHILDKISKQYTAETGFEKTLTLYKTKEILRYSSGETCLDLGCGEGLITRELAKKFQRVVGVDGSPNKITMAKKRSEKPNITYIASLFDDLKLNERFDQIVLSNVLEHLQNPPALLKMARSWLNPRGIVIATVPNALSLHRRLGRVMGLIDDLYALTPEDTKKGHTIIFDSISFTKAFRLTGYNIVYKGGVMLKPFPNGIMEKISSDKIIKGLYSLRNEFSDLCSTLFIVAQK